MRVLIVDDETFLAELVRLALEADGHACYAAATIADAEEILRSVRLDALTLDLVDGGRDPIEWIEEVVLTRPELHGRVFVLTDRSLGEHETLRLVASGARLMSKPFTLHGLRRAVATLGHVDEAPRLDDVSPQPAPKDRPVSGDL